MSEDVKEWWDLTAEWFQEDIDLDVGVDWTMSWRGDLTLLPDVAGGDVIELGCGGGQCSVALAKRGANVTGMDLSEAQLDYARDLAAEHNADVDFVQGDVTDLGFADDSFDVAFNSYVLQWVGDLDACFAETARVLRSGGRFVFSIPHPVYDVADPETGEVAESYFDTGRRVVEQEDLEHDMVVYDHTVSGIYNALVGAGLTVDRMREPGSDTPEDYEAGPWGEKRPDLLAKLPETLIFEGYVQ